MIQKCRALLVSLATDTGLPKLVLQITIDKLRGDLVFISLIHWVMTELNLKLGRFK